LFWHALQGPSGTRLNFSGSYHPEEDGQASKLSMDQLFQVGACSVSQPTFAFEEIMKLPTVNVVIALAENPSLNIRTK